MRHVFIKCWKCFNFECGILRDMPWHIEEHMWHIMAYWWAYYGILMGIRDVLNNRLDSPLCHTGVWSTGWPPVCPSPPPQMMMMIIMIFIMVMMVMMLLLVAVICFWQNLIFAFYSTPYKVRVYKWKFCLSICLSLCPSSLLILFLIQTLSSRNLKVTRSLSLSSSWGP